jgi:hypothetical protein
MRKSTILATLLAAGFVAGALTACNDNHRSGGCGNWGRFGGHQGGLVGTNINVEGAIAEGGDGGDGGNVANQGGQIAQDGSIVGEFDLEGLLGILGGGGGN